jgi:hypothetical protein
MVASLNIKIKGSGLTIHKTENLPTGDDVTDGSIVFDKSQGIPLYHHDGRWYKFSDDSIIPIVDIYLLAGQSNAHGHALVSTLTSDDQRTQDGLFYQSWHTETGNASTEQQYMNVWAESLMAGQTRGGSTGTHFGPELGFANRAKEINLGKDGNTIGILKYAVGSSGLVDTDTYDLSDWDLTAEGDRKGDCLRGFKRAIADGLGKLKRPYRLAGMIWWQGESGASVADLKAFIAHMRDWLNTNYTLDMSKEKFPFVITTTTSFWGTYLKQVSDEDDYVGVVNTQNLAAPKDASRTLVHPGSGETYSATQQDVNAGIATSVGQLIGSPDFRGDDVNDMFTIGRAYADQMKLALLDKTKSDDLWTPTDTFWWLDPSEPGSVTKTDATAEYSEWVLDEINLPVPGDKIRVLTSITLNQGGYKTKQTGEILEVWVIQSGGNTVTMLDPNNRSNFVYGSIGTRGTQWQVIKPPPSASLLLDETSDPVTGDKIRVKTSIVLNQWYPAGAGSGTTTKTTGYILEVWMIQNDGNTVTMRDPNNRSNFVYGQIGTRGTQWELVKPANSITHVSLKNSPGNLRDYQAVVSGTKISDSFVNNKRTLFFGESGGSTGDAKLTINGGHSTNVIPTGPHIWYYLIKPIDKGSTDGGMFHFNAEGNAYTLLTSSGRFYFGYNQHFDNADIIPNDTISLIAIEINWETNTVKQYLNGELKYTNITNVDLKAPGTSNDWVLMNYLTGYLEGHLMEFIASKATDDDTRIKTEGYLAHKWGFTGSLSSTHTYKNEPPTLE